MSIMLNIGLTGVLLHQLRETVPMEEVEKLSDADESNFAVDGDYPLIRVIDGDTIAVLINNQEQHVRLIGIDAPEPNDPGGPECYAEEATRHLRDLARTGVVTLVFDASQGERDMYERLLAYVEYPQGTDLGEAMLRNGYATEYTYDKPYDRVELYRAAEAEAVETQSGLWSDEACQ